MVLLFQWNIFPQSPLEPQKGPQQETQKILNHLCPIKHLVLCGFILQKPSIKIFVQDKIYFWKKTPL